MRSIDAERIRFKEMKSRGTSRTGKNEFHLTCPCTEKLRSARLESLGKPIFQNDKYEFSSQLQKPFKIQMKFFHETRFGTEVFRKNEQGEV